MMLGRLHLETFEPHPGAGATPELVSKDMLKETRLAAFEQGYKAGWDDSSAAKEGEQRHLRADIARNLQELSFTWNEARAHVLRSVAPLVEQMCTRVVPEVARAAIGQTVLAELQPLLETAAEAPISIVLNPASRAAVEAVLASAQVPPHRIREESSLGEGQVCLRLDAKELRIDLDEAAAAIAEAVRAYFHAEEELRDHG